MICMMSFFSITGLASGFSLLGEYPENAVMDPLEQHMEFLGLMLAIACVAVVITIIVMLCRSYRLRRLQSSEKDHVYKRKH